MLSDCCRYQLADVPVGGSAAWVRIHTYYDFSGASSGGDLFQQNESALDDIVSEMIRDDAKPSILTGDVNIDPSKSLVLRSAVAHGKLVDVGELVALKHGIDPQWTFKHGEGFFED